MIKTARRPSGRRFLLLSNYFETDVGKPEPGLLRRCLSLSVRPWIFAVFFRVPGSSGAALNIIAEQFPHHLGRSYVFFRTKSFKDSLFPGIDQDRQPGGTRFQRHNWRGAHLFTLDVISMIIILRCVKLDCFVQ